MNVAQELLAADRAHVWHPYGPMPGRADPLVVRAASGVRLQLRRRDGAGRRDVILVGGHPRLRAPGARRRGA